MSERLNKTSICSVVFLDIVDQSKKPVADQIKHKELFNDFINEAIKDVAQNDRILLDTGDGAAIALLGAPEEALFVAMTIRDNIVKYNQENNAKLLVRTGINLGPVSLMKDINGADNVLGYNASGAGYDGGVDDNFHLRATSPGIDSADRLADDTRGRLEALIETFAAATTPYLSIPRPQWRGRFGEYDHLARIKEWSANETEEEW